MKNTTKEEAREKIKLLVEKFEAYLELYKGKDYDEAKTRIEFVNPFFEALGWDMDNHEKRMPHDAEIIHEAKQRQSGKTKAPDYLFQAGKGKPFFYVEAKKPSVDLKNDKSPAFQLRKYGWNGSLKISLLTDFEEFAIYNCTKQPRSADTAKVGRLDYFTYKDYLPKFDFFWDTFAKENAYKGSIEAYTKKFAEVNEKESVSVKFLETLENWRTYLATSIALKNKDLDEAGLNYAVQQTIDRILFLKIAEDRGLEAPNQLLNAAKKGTIYQNIYELFKTADQRYNSGLFDFKKDKFASELVVDNKVIKNIIDDLYNEESFDFALIPVEILGYAYEQFLGKVIVFDQNKVARIELKPEVRKAGGVFYTPQYIVDYIVENTLGKLVAGKTPEEITKIKVLDPSCGSGSFLLGAYDYLINYHRDYYLKNIDYYVGNGMEDWLYQKQRKKYLNDDNTLSISIKKQILLNNIFGVDIDHQASEVTKLSLLIKCLEGETQSSIESQRKLFKEKALPTLDKNILSANSLIGFDFYDNNLDLLLQSSLTEQMKINAFDWKNGFKEIFKQGGFDVIIGNPPYVLLQELEQKAIFDYALKNYASAKYKIDMYQLFLEKAVKLLKINGLLGYIMPNTFLKNIHAEPIRKILLDNTKINEILLFTYQVFSQASVDTCILLFEKNIENTDNEIIIKEAKVVFLPKEVRKIKQDLFRKNKRLDFNISANSFDNEILAKIKSKSKSLSNFCGAYFGIQTFDRTKYVAKKKINKDYQPVIDGGNIEPYYLKPCKEFVYFIPEAIKSGGQEKFYRQERICIRQIGNVPIATIVGSGIFALNTVYNVYNQSDIDLKFILGIINSKANQFFWKKTHSDEKVTFPKIKKEAILSIPIPYLDISQKPEKEVYELIIRAVTTLLELNEKKSKTKLTTEIDQLNNRIKHNENLINEKLYQLYELNQEEIAIIDKA